MPTTRALKSLIGLASTGSRKRSSVDWHQRVLIDYSGSKMLIAGGSPDGVAWLVEECESATTDFRVAVPTGDVQQLVSSLRSADISVSCDEAKIRFRGNKGDDLRLAYAETAPGNEKGWPSLPGRSGKALFQVNASELAMAVRMVCPAMDDNEGDFNLDSLMLSTEGDVLQVIASNGRVIARQDIACVPGDTDQLRRVSGTAIKILRAFLAACDPKETVSICDTDGRLVFWTDRGEAHLATPAKRPPNLKAVFAVFDQPKQVTAEIATSELHSLLRAATIGYERGDSDTILIVATEGELLAASKPEHANQLVASTNCQCFVDGCSPAIMAFNANFIRQATMPADALSLSFLRSEKGQGDQTAVGWSMAVENDTGYRSIVTGCLLTGQQIAWGERIAELEGAAV